MTEEFDAEGRGVRGLRSFLDMMEPYRPFVDEIVFGLTDVVGMVMTYKSIQSSLYACFCASVEVCETHQNRVCKIVPEFSKLTFVRLTDSQFHGVFRYGKHALNPLPTSPKLITIV